MLDTISDILRWLVLDTLILALNGREGDTLHAWQLMLHFAALVATVLILGALAHSAWGLLKRRAHTPTL